MPISQAEALRFQEALIAQFPGFKGRTDIVPFEAAPTRLHRVTVEKIAARAQVSVLSLETSGVISFMQDKRVNLAKREGKAPEGLNLGRLVELTQAVQTPECRDAPRPT